MNTETIAKIQKTGQTCSLALEKAEGCGQGLTRTDYSQSKG